MGSESVVAVLFWVVAAVVMRFEMSRVFEIQRLLPLPVQFRALYALRVGAGLSGLWIPLFGPSLLYLLVVRTAGPAGFAVAVLAAVAFVILLGRLVAGFFLGLRNNTYGIAHLCCWLGSRSRPVRSACPSDLSFSSRTDPGVRDSPSTAP